MGPVTLSNTPIPTQGAQKLAPKSLQTGPCSLAKYQLTYKALKCQNQ